MRRLLTPIVAAAILTGCAANQPPAEYSKPTLNVEPITGRSYYLMIPHTYRRGTPAPVIVTCHGTDPFDTAGLHAREWQRLAERHNCILVCPKLTSTDGILGSGPTGPLLNDEKLIIAILGHLHRLYDIDRRNILITGFSGGGFPTYFVGLRHPDIFSVVVARNCNFSRRALEGWYPPEAAGTPVMVYWGENDFAAIRGQSGSAARYLRSKGFKPATAVLPRIGHERAPEVAMKFFLANFHGPPPPFRSPPGASAAAPGVRPQRLPR